MRLPTIARWSAGDQPDVTLFNEVSYALNFAMQPPQGWVVKTGTAQAIPLSTWTPINLSSVVIDTGAAAGDAPTWTASEPSRIYIRTPGWYDMEASLNWASNTGGTRRLLGIRHMGNFRWRTDVRAAGDMKQRFYGTVFVNANEYLELYAYTDTAQSLAADPGQNSLRTGFKFRWFSM